MKNKLLIFSMSGFLLISNASNAKDLAEIKQDLQAVTTHINAQNIKKFGPIVLAGTGAVGLGYYFYRVKHKKTVRFSDSASSTNQQVQVASSAQNGTQELNLRPKPDNPNTQTNGLNHAFKPRPSRRPRSGEKIGPRKWNNSTKTH